MKELQIRLIECDDHEACGFSGSPTVKSLVRALTHKTDIQYLEKEKLMVLSVQAGLALDKVASNCQWCKMQLVQNIFSTSGGEVRSILMETQKMMMKAWMLEMGICKFHDKWLENNDY